MKASPEHAFAVFTSGFDRWWPKRHSIGASPQRGVFGELVWLQDGTRYDGRLTLKAVFFTLLNWRSTGQLSITLPSFRPFSSA